MKLAAIHHVAIIVSDYEKARDFYVNKLGFAVVRENFRKERNDWICVSVMEPMRLNWRFLQSRTHPNV